METRQQELYSDILSDTVVDWGGPGEEWVNSATQQREQGLHSDPLKESDEDTVSEVNLNNTMTEEEREEIQLELSKLEEEMGTLRQVLTSKEKQHAELKQKLGITPLSELRSNLSRNWMDMQSSTAYKRTSETLSTAGQKTSAAFSTLGSTISKKFEDMRSNSIGGGHSGSSSSISPCPLRPLLSNLQTSCPPSPPPEIFLSNFCLAVPTSTSSYQCTGSLSLLCTCPNHLHLASLTLSPKHLSTCAVPLILSILLTPREKLSIFISATSSSASCLLLSATVSKPYNIAGLTTLLDTFPFILADTLLLHITPDTLLQ
ncbi:tumor protein D53 isoform X3 [Synchiropus splendidus]|uniref:tumor protein D53 isoform X3 n=1 Tax=Synchiropus splendidus TaxID=270530 RepID=UPI00237E4DB7|nr:tumor protein D53 isoform X3 [Synchiropus splendidus]